jgi:hypothetical protein
MTRTRSGKLRIATEKIDGGRHVRQIRYLPCGECRRYILPRRASGSVREKHVTVRFKAVIPIVIGILDPEMQQREAENHQQR